jgi:hypothetical protein
MRGLDLLKRFVVLRISPWPRGLRRRNGLAHASRNPHGYQAAPTAPDGPVGQSDTGRQERLALSSPPKSKK